MEGFYVDSNGKNQMLYMGSYGIGIGRAIGSIVETHHDEKGIIWPSSIAPFQVHLIGLDLQDESISKQAFELYQKLLDQNIEVLFDDRLSSTAGEKFADADLIGTPQRVVISKRSLENGGVEIKSRTSTESKIISIEELLSQF